MRFIWFTIFFLRVFCRFTCGNCGRVQLPGVYCKGCGRKVPAKYRRKDNDGDTIASRSIKKAAKKPPLQYEESPKRVAPPSKSPLPNQPPARKAPPMLYPDDESFDSSYPPVPAVVVRRDDRPPSQQYRPQPQVSIALPTSKEAVAAPKLATSMTSNLEQLLLTELMELEIRQRHNADTLKELNRREAKLKPAVTQEQARENRNAAQEPTTPVAAAASKREKVKTDPEKLAFTPGAKAAKQAKVAKPVAAPQPSVPVAVSNNGTTAPKRRDSVMTSATEVTEPPPQPPALRILAAAPVAINRRYEEYYGGDQGYSSGYNHQPDKAANGSLHSYSAPTSHKPSRHQQQQQSDDTISLPPIANQRPPSHNGQRLSLASAPSRVDAVSLPAISNPMLTNPHQRDTRLAQHKEIVHLPNIQQQQSQQGQGQGRQSNNYMNSYQPQISAAR